LRKLRLIENAEWRKLWLIENAECKCRFLGSLSRSKSVLWPMALGRQCANLKVDREKKGA
jgi:hypothetical protein